MKKFLKYYLPIVIIFVCLYTSVSNIENGLKCFNENGCQVASKTRNVVVKIDGNESSRSKVFEDEKRFYLISDAYKKNSFSLMVIDKSKNDVSYPEHCYTTIYSSYLLLADCVSGIFLSDTVKGSGFDTRLSITDKSIDFVIPDYLSSEASKNEPKHRIEILFKGE